MTNKTNTNIFHTKTAERILDELETSSAGLSSQEAKERIEKFGSNEIPGKKEKPPFLIFLKQFHSVLIYILFIAAAISFFVDHMIDAYVILAIILINATIGFIQEYKAEKAIEALKRMIVPSARVFRDKELVQLPAKDLVSGDVIFLEEGDKIPADARLLEMKNFRTVESSLTGESLPTVKSLRILPEKIDLADCKNMVWMGTFVAGGQAKAIVVATGAETAIGRVAESLKEIKKVKTHFEGRSDTLAKQMGLIAILGAVLTFIVGYFFRDFQFFEIFLFTIASLVSGIPEGLPAVLIIVLAVGAHRMAKRRAIIRTLSATETLGVVTAVATDKTGTLTQNTMNVEKIILTDEKEVDVSGEGWRPSGKFFQANKEILPLEKNSLLKLLRIAVLCNNSRLVKEKDNNKYGIIGDPTEAALLVLAEKAGLKRGEALEREERIDDLPFNPELKYRASISALVQGGKEKEKEIYVIGAPERVLEHSSYFLENEQEIKIDLTKQKEFSEKIYSLAKNGMRVLGLAYKKTEPETKSLTEDLIKDLVFVGLVGIKDPPRAGVKEAIAKTKNAGIRVIMKTGDHKETALAIAKEIGLVDEHEKEGKYPLVFTEKELLELSPEDFEDVVRNVSVFARLTPNMKLRLVETLQKQGHLVAMTGDGVNDAPALKKADIGISMGIIGTDVARESSSIVLTDDNFASIVDAIEEGRTVFTNTRQASSFMVTTNFSEDLTIIAALFLGLPLILLPTQILWLNVVTGTFVGIGLAFEPTRKNILNEPPRRAGENILSKEILPFVVINFIVMTVLTLFVFKFYLSNSLTLARTGAFATMTFTQLFNVFNMRALDRSIFKIGFLSNRLINIALIVSIVLLFLVIYFPFFEIIFQFVSLGILDLIMIIALSSLVLWFGELYKYFERRKRRNR